MSENFNPDENRRKSEERTGTISSNEKKLVITKVILLLWSAEVSNNKNETLVAFNFTRHIFNAIFLKQKI